MFGKELVRGIYTENPIFRLLLGLCPALAVTTAVDTGLGMGLATTTVLLGSNLVVSLLKNIIPPAVRIPSFIVIIATFVTIVGMVMEAFFYPMFAALGIFIPLIVVNCLILGRAEAFASKNTLGRSLIDAIVMGLGFTVSLGLLGAVRELLGSGSLLGFQLVPGTVDMALIFALPPGAFISLGLLLALLNYVSIRRKEA